MNESLNRRHFIKKAGAASLSLGVVGYFGAASKSDAQDGAAPTASGANNRINAAVIGTGAVNGRGQAHIDCLSRLEGVQIAYICDVDDRAIAKGVANASRKQHGEPKGVKDFRKVLDDKSVDIVTIATPDHWHTPLAILALQAGKHVYVEKPCSHNPRECELLIAAVEKTKRLCQMGNQRRSFVNTQATVKAIHDGAIGKAYMGRCWYVNNRKSLGKGNVVAVPPELDYNLWQGPAPRQPYYDNRIPYNWHWFWNYGTGEALNNGTHEVDVCRWALGVDWPTRVTSNGGRYAYQDDWQTPDTQVISWDFDAEGKCMTWEGNSCNNYPIEKLDRGVIIYGTEGAALLENDNCTLYDKSHRATKAMKSSEVADPTNTVSTGIGGDTLHFKNFVDAVRLGTPLNSPIANVSKSVTLLHLGNIAWRTKHCLNIDTANGHILNDPEAMKLWGREYEPGWEPKV